MTRVGVNSTLEFFVGRHVLDLPAAGERWTARSRRHGGEVIEVLRVTGPTVKFEVVRGAANHRKQVYALRLEHFLRAFTKGLV